MSTNDGRIDLEARRLTQMERPQFGSAFMAYLADCLLDALVSRLEQRQDQQSAEMVEALAVLMELAANGEQQVPGLVNRQAGEVVGEVSYLIEFV